MNAKYYKHLSVDKGHNWNASLFKKVFSADRVHCRRQKIYLYKFVYFRAYPFSDPGSYSSINPDLYALIPRREYHNSHYHRKTQIGVDGTRTDYTDTDEVISVYYDEFKQTFSLCGLWNKSN